MNLSVTGINNYRSKINDELGAVEFMSALSCVHLATKATINSALTRLNSALCYWINRCDGEFDSKWILKVSGMIENSRLAVANKRKHGIKARKDIFKQFARICFQADSAINFLINEDEKKFSNAMTFFSSRAFYNQTGIEKVVAMDDKFKIIDREIDPDCSGTTMILNILTRNKILEMDEIDIMGWANELYFYPEDNDPQSITEDIKNNSKESSVIVLRVPTGGYVVATMREFDAMEIPYFASKDALNGALTLLIDFFKNNKDKAENEVILDNLTDFMKTLEEEDVVNDRIAADRYISNFKQYESDLDVAYGILSRYNLPKVVRSWPADSYTDDVKLVVGLMMTGDDQVFYNLLMPESRDDMYIEASDYDAFINLVKGINRSFERTKDLVMKKMKL